MRYSRNKYFLFFLLVSSFLFYGEAAHGAVKKVAMIGSSSFEGFCGVYHFDNALTNLLSGYQFDCFYKRGETPKWFFDQFKEKVRNKGYSDVIVYAGLNGLGSKMSMTFMESNLASLFTLAKEENMRVIVVSSQPFKGNEAWTKTWGENIIANNNWAASNSKVDIFIDTYSHFDDGTGAQKKEYSGSDKLHVNKKGQELTFKLIAQEAYGQNQGINPNPVKPKKISESYGVGKQCQENLTNSDCYNGLDCEDSSLGQSNDDFCVCSKPEHCANAYGNGTNETWECKNDGSIDAAYALHFCQSNKRGAFYPITETGEAANLTDATITSDIGHALTNTPLTEDELKLFFQKPQPKIKIPGLNFSEITIDGKLSKDDAGDTYLNIPFLGEYMAAIYKYLVVIAGIFCVARIIIGGFLFTIPDTSGNSKSTAKTMITQAIVGLLIVNSSYLILYSINPNLVQFKNLKIIYTHSKPFLETIEPAVYTAVTGQVNLPKGEIVKLAVKAGADLGLTDPCYMVAIVAMESGGKANAIGHDENARSALKVGARKKFLLSGTKKSGETFTKIVQNPSEYDYAIHNKSSIVNDDKFTNTPPDYGLDWDYSHGFGVGQTTFGGGSKCDGQRGIKKGGECFTIPELLKAETNVRLIPLHFVDDMKCAAKKGLTGDQQLMGAFYAYNAGCGGLNKINSASLPTKLYPVKAMGKYAACKKDPQYQNNVPEITQEEFEAKFSDRDSATDTDEK